MDKGTEDQIYYAVAHLAHHMVSRVPESVAKEIFLKAASDCDLADPKKSQELAKKAILDVYNDYIKT